VVVGAGLIEDGEQFLMPAAGRFGHEAGQCLSLERRPGLGVEGLKVALDVREEPALGRIAELGVVGLEVGVG
jgi:hypothetical protein